MFIISAYSHGNWKLNIKCVSHVCMCPQIITKEIEANEWKTKYEESRMEVLEMR